MSPKTFEEMIKEFEKHLLEKNDEHEALMKKVNELIEEINKQETSDERGEYFFYVISRIVEESKVDTATAISTLEAVKFMLLQKFYTVTALMTLELTRRLGLLGNEK